MKSNVGPSWIRTHDHSFGSDCAGHYAMRNVATLLPRLRIDYWIGSPGYDSNETISSFLSTWLDTMLTTRLMNCLHFMYILEQTYRKNFILVACILLVSVNFNEQISDLYRRTVSSISDLNFIKFMAAYTFFKETA